MFCDKFGFKKNASHTVKLSTVIFLQEAKFVWDVHGEVETTLSVFAEWDTFLDDINHADWNGFSVNTTSFNIATNFICLTIKNEIYVS